MQKNKTFITIAKNPIAWLFIIIMILGITNKFDYSKYNPVILAPDNVQILKNDIGAKLNAEGYLNYTVYFTSHSPLSKASINTKKHMILISYRLENKPQQIKSGLTHELTHLKYERVREITNKLDSILTYLFIAVCIWLKFIKKRNINLESSILTIIISALIYVELHEILPNLYSKLWISLSLSILTVLVGSFLLFKIVSSILKQDAKKKS